MVIASTSPHCSSRCAIKRAGRAVRPKPKEVRRPVPTESLRSEGVPVVIKGATKGRHKMAMRAQHPMAASRATVHPRRGAVAIKTPGSLSL